MFLLNLCFGAFCLANDKEKCLLSFITAVPVFEN